MWLTKKFTIQLTIKKIVVINMLVYLSCVTGLYDKIIAEEFPPDSLNTPANPDSLKAGLSDSLKQDSTNVIPDTSEISPKKSSVGMDTTLEYTAKDINIIVPDRITYLVGDAVVKYKTMTLKAEKITVDWNTNILTAEGLTDTVYHKQENSDDSTMSVEWKGLPTLTEKGDVMHGFKMLYNFKSEKGRVIKGRTNYDTGYYFGESMKKVGKKTINISHGYFTSCEKEDDPHFHFRSRRIKVLPKDKVIAKPVVLYLGHIPVGIIPFAVFPNKTGRQSGIIIPSYGQTAREGRFIRGLGYYWAASDYFDAKAEVDYFDRSGWFLRGDTRYKIRYLLNGSVRGSFTRKNFISGEQQRRWDLIINHRQDFDPTMRLTVNGNFISDDRFYKDMSITPNLQREIRSTAVFNKSWSEQGMSLSANLRNTRDIDAQRTTRLLPQVTFSLSQRRPFARDKKEAITRNKNEKEEPKWYENFYYSYRNTLYNQKIIDTVKTTRSRYFDHNISTGLTGNSKLFGILTLNQSISYNERWFDRYKKNSFNYETNSVESDTVSGFASRRTFNYSLTTSTKIYGMFSPNIGNVKALRHVITPRITFSYRPDFSESKWGYVDTFTDTTGKEVKVSRFLEGVSSSKQKNIGFNLDNLFQMKTGEGEKEKKYDLFRISSRTSYNFEKEKNKLSDLSSSLSSTLVKNLNLNMSFTHSFYKYDTEDNRVTNKLLMLEDKPVWKRSPLRLTSFRISSTIRLQGSKKSKEQEKKKSAFEEDEDVIVTDDGDVISKDEYNTQFDPLEGDRFDPRSAFEGFDIPWRANFSFDFNLNKSNPENVSKTYYINLSGMEIQLTKNWRIQYQARYDLEKKQLLNHSFRFYRDLHCWQAFFEWVPSGTRGQSFFFKINVKSPQLRDLKWEKRGGSSIYRPISG